MNGQIEPSTPTHIENANPSLSDGKANRRLLLRHELVMDWAETFWQEYIGDSRMSFMVLRSSEGPASPLARQRIKSDRTLKNGARYIGFRAVSCPFARPIHQFYEQGRGVVVSQGTGAFIYSFERNGTQFDVLYVSANYEDDSPSSIELAFVPENQMATWAAFEKLCDRASNYLKRSPKAYMFGAKERSFEPKVAWEDVILSETLKADVRADMEGFFTEGVKIYRELGLAPFRKLLFVGPPGTGKSTLCVALAKIALEQHGVVIYVSSSQQNCNESNFNYIHRALRIANTAQFPVLLIVEDLDAYLLEKDEKSQILNVLDGVESPNNSHGVVLVATTNYPEIIDERITKRPGRIDRIFYIPPIEDEEQALRMLKRYLGQQWRPEHGRIARDVIGQTGVFVREIALYARILSANAKQSNVSLETLKQSVQRLKMQLATGYDLQPRRALGFGVTPDQPSHQTEIAAKR